MANTESRPLRLPLDHPRTTEADGDFQRRCSRAVDRSFLGRKRLDDKLAIARRHWPIKLQDPPPLHRGDTLSLSFVIEWDNVKLSDLDRARRMFETLVAQLRELEQAHNVEAEFIFGFNAGEFDAASVKETVERIWPPLEPIWPLRYVSDTDLDYYQIKNLGARQASGEFVGFSTATWYPRTAGSARSWTHSPIRESRSCVVRFMGLRLERLRPGLLGRRLSI